MTITDPILRLRAYVDKHLTVDGRITAESSASPYGDLVNIVDMLPEVFAEADRLTAVSVPLDADVSKAIELLSSGVRAADPAFGFCQVHEANVRVLVRAHDLQAKRAVEQGARAAAAEQEVERLRAIAEQAVEALVDLQADPFGRTPLHEALIAATVSDLVAVLGGPVPQPCEGGTCRRSPCENCPVHAEQMDSALATRGTQ